MRAEVPHDTRSESQTTLKNRIGRAINIPSQLLALAAIGVAAFGFYDMDKTDRAEIRLLDDAAKIVPAATEDEIQKAQNQLRLILEEDGRSEEDISETLEILGRDRAAYFIKEILADEKGYPDRLQRDRLMLAGGILSLAASLGGGMFSKSLRDRT